MHHLLLTVCVGGGAGASPPTLVRIPTSAARSPRPARRPAGRPVAQFSLGSILYYSANDTAQAVDWFRKAAAQRYAPAEFHMGQLYDFGFGVAQDDRRSAELVPQGRRSWQRRGAARGRGLLPEGTRVEADAAEAARWYRRAADGDDIRAQYQLGQLYFEGTGVPRDYAAAYLWFSLAAGQAPLADNRKGLLELRNIAAARMTPEQVAEAAPGRHLETVGQIVRPGRFPAPFSRFCLVPFPFYPFSRYCQPGARLLRTRRESSGRRASGCRGPSRAAA